MPKLEDKDILHVAKLSKLELTKKEVAKFRSQLSSVLDYVDSLNHVDTNDVEPTSQTTGLSNVFRDDEIQSSDILEAKDALSGTDNSISGYFVVDALLKERSNK